ncbi:aldehyde dehydrogenase family protein, partial [Rhodococcus sp. 14C212]|uniref:aldehyde dehydrogenase family protein n=1 Tax=Rhodococcus sp. 14C212 TaxID=2711209 RepID=UPI001F0D6D5A
ACSRAPTPSPGYPGGTRAQIQSRPNHSDYGLGGSVRTSDPERGARFARNIAGSTVGINGYANDPTDPFGGIKNSGL